MSGLSTSGPCSYSCLPLPRASASACSFADFAVRRPPPCVLPASALVASKRNTIAATASSTNFASQPRMPFGVTTNISPLASLISLN